jgi:hypothetical protein
MVQRKKSGEPVLEDGKVVPLTSHTLSPVCTPVPRLMGDGVSSALHVCVFLVHVCMLANLHWLLLGIGAFLLYMAGIDMSFLSPEPLPTPSPSLRVCGCARVHASCMAFMHAYT